MEYEMREWALLLFIVVFVGVIVLVQVMGKKRKKRAGGDSR